MEFTPYQARGLTLLELITTVTIIGFTLLVALPAFNTLKARNDMVSSVNLFLSQLHLARSTAINSERRIVLCPSGGKEQCIRDHRRWHGGYLIFEDHNKNRVRDAGEPVISFEAQLENGIRVVSSSQHRNKIVFRPLGRAWFSNTTVRFCHQQDESLNRAVIVSNNGRVRTVKKLRNGAAINCE
jgi:type IV fimbrial biogenesis protein FimT